MKHYRPSKQTEDEKIHWVISQLKESKGDFKREIEALTEVYNMLITQQAFEFSHDIFKKEDAS